MGRRGEGRGGNWFICCFHKGHSLLYGCGIYYRKKKMTKFLGRERRAKQADTHRRLRSPRLLLVPRTVRVWRPLLFLPCSALCFLRSPSCVPCILDPPSPVFRVPLCPAPVLCLLCPLPPVLRPLLCPVFPTVCQRWTS